MPRNTWAGIVLAGLSVALGFALIWYMWWLVVVSFAGILVISIMHTFNYDRDYFIPAEAVVAVESKRHKPLPAGE
jgi:cytochrome o ubiquinol oxidase subunit 1